MLHAHVLVSYPTMISFFLMIVILLILFGGLDHRRSSMLGCLVMCSMSVFSGVLVHAYLLQMDMENLKVMGYLENDFFYFTCQFFHMVVCCYLWQCKFIGEKNWVKGHLICIKMAFILDFLGYFFTAFFNT